MRTKTPSPPKRRRNGQPILPIIYVPPQSKVQKYLPVMIVASCGVWIFFMGALLERLPPGRSFPMETAAVLTSATRRIGIGSLDSREEPTRLLKEADSGEKPTLNNQATILKAQKEPLKDSLPPKIPNILIFTHAVNLLTYEPPLQNKIDQTKEEIAEQEELLVLKKNVQASIEMHPNSQVRFLTDQDCIQSLKAALGENDPLIEYFQKESKGMYKADICRGAALWETGGIYLDVDVGLRMPLTDVLDANTTFATSMVHKDSQHVGNFFQAFMATTPRHAILERYLKLFLEHYQGTRVVKKGPLGVILLRQAFDDVVLQKPQEVMKINGKQVETISRKDKYFRLGPQTVDTKHQGRIQLWQEVLYDPKFFSDVVPAPTWGTRRACHFLVLANRKLPFTVPMYSRIAGSRMCPVSTLTADKETKTLKEAK